jgi:RNA polymerase sigma factor (sigma-70 family)
MLDELDDEALIGQCRAGREAAWSTLIRRYQRLVYTVPRRAGLGDAAAADVFQVTFSRLVEHLGRIADASRVRAWLVTTARRETLRVLAEQQRQGELPAPAGGDDDESDAFDRLPDDGPLPEAMLGELQDLDRLRCAVDKLDPRSRQFVELLFLQDEALPYEEIARRLGLAEGSIGPTRQRVLAKLRTILEAL